MKFYSYVIRDAQKNVKKGVKGANSEEELRKAFQEDGYVVYFIEEAQHGSYHPLQESYVSFNWPLKVAVTMLVLGLATIVVVAHKKNSLDNQRALIEEPVNLEKEQNIEFEKGKVPTAGIYWIKPKKTKSISEGDYSDPNVITIKLKGQEPKDHTKEEEKAYREVTRRYQQALGINDRSFYQEVIRSAQNLLNRGKYIEQMKSIINSCRKRMRELQ